MIVRNRNKSRKKPSGLRGIILAVLSLIVAIVAGYYIFAPGKIVDLAPEKSEFSTIKPVMSPLSTPQATIPKPPAVPLTPDDKQIAYPSTPIISEPEKTDTRRGSSSLLAIIIDDMGSNMSEARSLAAINVPLTFSIIPGLSMDTDVAEYAASQKIDTMIHIPMQSKGWPTKRLETNGLLVSMDADELQKRVSGFIQRLPGAVGVNNHMGSEFTEQEDKMLSILAVLKEKNLFFIDSATSPQSSGLRVAQKLGVKSARRNVFLDNKQERGYIIGQLRQAVRLARTKGSAIVICHPHHATMAALSETLPGLAKRGIQLVSVSQLVR